MTPSPIIPLSSIKKPNVHIIFIRHEQAISNICCESTAVSIDITTTKDFDLEQLARGGQQIQDGDYWPDGLTCEGKKQASRKLTAPLENVEFIGCSTATRAIETAQRMLPHFNFGPGCARYENGQPVIHCDDRILEATNWPQDRRAKRWQKDGRTYTSYFEAQGEAFEAQGGAGTDAGNILGVATVDLTDTDWCMDHTQESSTPEDIEKRVAQWRQAAFERACATSSETTSRHVYVIHNGIFNFIRQDWRCRYGRRDENSCWEFEGSGVLPNGGVVAYEFEVDATLTEIPRNRDIEKAFGDRYITSGEEFLVLRNPDGSIVDQKRGHLDFVHDTANEVAVVTERQRELLEKMSGWLASR